LRPRFTVFGALPPDPTLRAVPRKGGRDVDRVAARRPVCGWLTPPRKVSALSSKVLDRHPRARPERTADAEKPGESRCHSAKSR